MNLQSLVGDNTQKPLELKTDLTISSQNMDNLKGESRDFINFVDSKVNHQETFEQKLIEKPLKPKL